MKTKTELEAYVAAALSEYEAAYRAYYRAYMAHRIWSDEGRRAKAALDEARKKHTAAVEAAHPDWIVM